MFVDTLASWLYAPDQAMHLAPGLTLTYTAGRLVLADSHRSLLLAPHEQNMTAISRLVERWPVTSA